MSKNAKKSADNSKVNGEKEDAVVREILSIRKGLDKICDLLGEIVSTQKELANMQKEVVSTQREAVNMQKELANMQREAVSTQKEIKRRQFVAAVISGRNNCAVAPNSPVIRTIAADVGVYERTLGAEQSR